MITLAPRKSIRKFMGKISLDVGDYELISEGEYFDKYDDIADGIVTEWSCYLSDYSKPEKDIISCTDDVDLVFLKKLLDQGITKLNYDCYGKSEKWGVPYIKCEGNIFIFQTLQGGYDFFIGTEEEFNDSVGGIEREKYQSEWSGFIINWNIQNPFVKLLQAIPTSLEDFYEILRFGMGKEYEHMITSELIEDVVSIALDPGNIERPEIIKAVRPNLNKYGEGLLWDKLVVRKVDTTPLGIPYIEVETFELYNLSSIIIYLYYDGKVLQPFVPVRGNWIKIENEKYSNFFKSPFDHLELEKQGVMFVEKEGILKTIKAKCDKDDFLDNTLKRLGVARYEDDTMPLPFYDECYKEFNSAFSDEPPTLLGKFIDPSSIESRPLVELEKLVTVLRGFKEISVVNILMEDVKLEICKRKRPSILRNLIGRYFSATFNSKGKVTYMILVKSINENEVIVYDEISCIDMPLSAATTSMKVCNSQPKESSGNVFLEEDGLVFLYKEEKYKLTEVGIEEWNNFIKSCNV